GSGEANAGHHAAGYLIFWTTVSNEVHGITLSTAGYPGPNVLFASSAANSQAVLLKDRNGGYLAAWETSGSPRTVKFRELDQYGAPIGTESVLATALDSTAFAAVGVSAGAGRFAIAYTRLEPDRPYLSVRVAWKILSSTSPQSCADSLACGGGSCVDGVCCDTPCGGNSTTDCQACSVAAGATLDGVCGPVINNQVCRAAANSCDAAEHCTGSSTACPADSSAPDGTACSNGVCSNGACAPVGAGGQSSGTGGASGGSGTGGSGTGGSGTGGSVAGSDGEAAGSSGKSTSAGGAGMSSSAGNSASGVGGHAGKAGDDSAAGDGATSNASGAGPQGAGGQPDGEVEPVPDAGSPSSSATTGSGSDSSCSCRAVGSTSSASSSLSLALAGMLIAFTGARRRRRANAAAS
ncbi:MAG TPA: hypothetical protein VGC79_26830, partial [Polyangiaceae bacterium]